MAPIVEDLLSINNSPLYLKKHLLFDLDRTLWDFGANAERTFRAMFNQFGLASLCHTDFETFHRAYVDINNMLWEAYRNGTVSKEYLSMARFSLTLKQFGQQEDSPVVSRLSREMGEFYVLQGPKQKGLMPGARELLEWLAQRHDRYTLSIITNGFSEAQLPKMRSSNIDGYFDHFFLSEDLGFMKPDRRFFDAALRLLGAEADECLVIGDDYRVDIVGAANAGIEQVYYNHLHASLEPSDHQPTYMIYELEELEPILDCLE